jgi:hypothetical protein
MLASSDVQKNACDDSVLLNAAYVVSVPEFEGLLTLQFAPRNGCSFVPSCPSDLSIHA